MGNIWFGDSTVAANKGKPIAANGTFEMKPGEFHAGQHPHTVVFDTLWVDADTNGNDVEWVALVV